MTWNLFISIVAVPAAFVIAVGALFTACRQLDNEMPKSWVKTATRLLDPKANTISVVTFFLAYFDRFFYSQGGRRPRFFRCVTFSLLVFVVIASSWAIISTFVAPGQLERLYKDFLFSHDDWLIPRTPLQNIQIIVAIVIAANVVGDYLSLWQTRFILAQLAVVTSTKRMVALWITDIFLSLLIFFVFSVSLIQFLLQFPLGILQRTFEFDWRVPLIALDPSIYLFGEPGIGVVWSVSLYTTLSTTAWAGASIIIVKVWTILRLANRFPIAREKPFGALTMMVVAVLFVFAVVATLFFHLVSKLLLS